MPFSFLRYTMRLSFTIAVLASAQHSSPALAEHVEAPVELLYAPGNMLVAGTVVEINPSGRLVFERGDVLGGKGRPPEKIDVRVPKRVLDSAKPGERYIFGYSLARADARDPTRVVANPNGAVLISSIGLDPALFKDTPAARELLKAGRSEHGRESRRFFDLLMKGFASGDRSLQMLAAGEIALEPEIGERIGASDRALIEKVARDAHTFPDVRASLLQSASERPAELGDWWQATSTDVVTTSPLDGYADEASDPAGLILLALEVLDKHAVKVAPDALKRWLGSSRTPLVERACLMLRRESPVLERSAINAALADSRLPDPTRKFLNDHLRRLDLMESRVKARKGGAD
ncbi:MAG: hypothetical protein ABIS07_11605 [Dokdonella sp.]